MTPFMVSDTRWQWPSSNGVITKLRPLRWWQSRPYTANSERFGHGLPRHEGDRCGCRHDLLLLQVLPEELQYGRLRLSTLR